MKTKKIIRNFSSYVLLVFLVSCLQMAEQGDNSTPTIKVSTKEVNLKSPVVMQFNKPISVNLRKYLNKYTDATHFSLISGNSSGARFSKEELLKNPVVAIYPPGGNGKIRLIVNSNKNGTSSQAVEVIK